MRFEDFRTLCMSLPEVEERETWGEATFRVRGRIFAIGAPEARHLSIKASLDDQAGLIELDPTTFSPAPYSGRFGWVSVRLSRLPRAMAERLVVNAWERTAPRRLVSSSRKPGGGSASLRPAGGRAAKGSPRR